MAPETLADLLDRTARRHPNRTALLGRRPGGARWGLSWTGLRRRVHAAAATLLEAGAEPGEPAVVALPAGPGRVLASLAVHRVGARELPLAPELPPLQAEAVLAEAGPTLAVTGDGPLQPVLEETAGALVAAGDLPALDAPGAGSAPEDAGSGAEPREGGLLLPTGWGEATEVLAVPASAVAAGVGAAAEALPVGPGDRVLQAAPPTHVPARVAGTLVPMARGAAVAFPAGGSDAEPGRARGRRLLEAIRGFEADVLSVEADGVGDVWRADEGLADLETVLSAGAAAPEARADLEEVGLGVVEVVGDAETGPVVAAGPRREGGLAPVPGVGLEVREGELHADGPGVPTQGPAASALSATGLRADLDEGRVQLRGRVEARLGEGKAAVQAEDVEAALRAAHPAVARAVAVVVDGEVGAAVLPDLEVEGGEKAVLEAARAAEPGPRLAAVLQEGPTLADGLTDHAGEVHRGRCGEAWEGTLSWEPVTGDA